MAISVQNLLKERKYPFIFSLFLLLIFVFFILLTNNESPTYLAANLDQSPAISNPNTKTLPQHDGDDDLPANATVITPTDLQFDWKVCNSAIAVDYIPCLDNFNAIKALKSRRHMEHRERHCPEQSPRCLVSVPEGYRVPVPWPKSRDMVRLLLW